MPKGPSALKDTWTHHSSQGGHPVDVSQGLFASASPPPPLLEHELRQQRSRQPNSTDDGYARSAAPWDQGSDADRSPSQGDTDNVHDDEDDNDEVPQEAGQEDIGWLANGGDSGHLMNYDFALTRARPNAAANAFPVPKPQTSHKSHNLPALPSVSPLPSSSSIPEDPDNDSAEDRRPAVPAAEALSSEAMSQASELYEALGTSELVDAPVETLLLLYEYAKDLWSLPSDARTATDRVAVAHSKLGLSGAIDEYDGTVPVDAIDNAWILQALRVNTLEYMLLKQGLGDFGAVNAVGGTAHASLSGGSGAFGAARPAQSAAPEKKGRGSGGGRHQRSVFDCSPHELGLFQGSEMHEDGGVSGTVIAADFEAMRGVITECAYLAHADSRFKDKSSAFKGAPLLSSDLTLRNPMQMFGDGEKVKNSDYHTLLRFLLRRACDSGVRRHEGTVYKQIMSPPLRSADGARRRYPTHAWTPLCSMEEWVRRETAHGKSHAHWVIATSGGNLHSVVHELNAGIDSEFRRYVPDRHLFSFRNGILWGNGTHGPEFFYYGDPLIPSEWTSCHFHDTILPAQDLMAFMAPQPRFLQSVRASNAAVASERQRKRQRSSAAAPANPADPDPAEQQPAADVPRRRRARELTSSELNDWWRLPTPNFDSILRTQTDPKKNKRIRDVAEQEAVMKVAYATHGGRNFYDVREYDTWEFAPMVVGRAATGKSTWLDTIQKCYGVESVGVLANNANERFGLQNLLDKMLIVCYEMTEKFGLDQTQMQSMITGESVTAQRKNGDDVTVHKWKTPMLIAGNETAAYNDNSGSFARRLLQFFFDVALPSDAQDMTLSKRITEELPILLVKFMLAYRTFAARFGSHSLWSKKVPFYGAQDAETGEWIRTGIIAVLPQYYHDARERLAAASHPLTACLKSFPDLKVCVRKDKKIGMPWERFTRKVDEFMKEQNIRGSFKWTSEAKYAASLEVFGLTWGKLETWHKYNGENKGPGTDWIWGVMETSVLKELSLEDAPPLTRAEAELRANLQPADRVDAYRLDALRIAEAEERKTAAEAAAVAAAAAQQNGAAADGSSNPSQQLPPDVSDVVGDCGPDVFDMTAALQRLHTQDACAYEPAPFFDAEPAALEVMQNTRAMQRERARIAAIEAAARLEAARAEAAAACTASTAAPAGRAGSSLRPRGGTGSGLSAGSGLGTVARSSGVASPAAHSSGASVASAHSTSRAHSSARGSGSVSAQPVRNAAQLLPPQESLADYMNNS
jgi:hypothetical protein